MTEMSCCTNHRLGLAGPRRRAGNFFFGVHKPPLQIKHVTGGLQQTRKSNLSGEAPFACQSSKVMSALNPGAAAAALNFLALCVLDVAMSAEQPRALEASQGPSWV